MLLKHGKLSSYISSLRSFGTMINICSLGIKKEKDEPVKKDRVVVTVDLSKRYYES